MSATSSETSRLKNGIMFLTRAGRSALQTPGRKFRRVEIFKRSERVKNVASSGAVIRTITKVLTGTTGRWARRSQTRTKTFFLSADRMLYAAVSTIPASRLLDWNFYEAHLPAKETQARPYSRVSRPHEQRGRPQRPQASPRQGSQAAHAVAMSAALASPHPRARAGAFLAAQNFSASTARDGRRPTATSCSIPSPAATMPTRTRASACRSAARSATPSCATASSARFARRSIELEPKHGRRPRLRRARASRHRRTCLNETACTESEIRSPS